MPKFRRLLKHSGGYKIEKFTGQIWAVISAKIQVVFEERNSPFKFRVTSAKIQAVFEERDSPFKCCGN